MLFSDVGSDYEGFGDEFVGEASNTTDSVAPDQAVIDGHVFHLSHPSQPPEHSEALDDLVEDETATYASMPAELKQWEIPGAPIDPE